MTLPPEDKTPIIMVGPGTGIAAFRSFIQHRSATKSAGKMTLFFGCRSKDSDYYYCDEWQTTPNLTVHTAFSRDGDSKRYVQHVIKENKDEIGHLIVNEGAYIYVSGRAKYMPASVEKAFIEAIEAVTGEENGKDFVK